MKVVLDTNVLLGAYAASGLCQSLTEACLASHEVILSEHILSELSRNLLRKLYLPVHEIEDIISLWRHLARVVDPASVDCTACRDSSDAAILGTALAGGADCIVTGDNDLLVLGQFRQIPILSPRSFQELLS